jgi:putative pre-16S rRNA nuclease
MSIKDEIAGKRIAGIDYGKKRVGVAVADEMHITASPRKTLIVTEDSFWEDLLDMLEFDRIGAIVVGVPYRLDDKNQKWINEIKEFIKDLTEKSSLPVYEYDESYSSKRAVSTMIEIGKKKKKRAKKGSTDMIAAAIILRDFMNENEG